MYREILQPVHKRAVQWAKNRGLYTHLHSCGDIMPLIPDILETGVDALNPIEIKAGMDVQKLKANCDNHSIPNSVSLEGYRTIVDAAKKYGSY